MHHPLSFAHGDGVDVRAGTEETGPRAIAQRPGRQSQFRATCFRDGCDGPDDSPADMLVAVTADSERLGNVGEATELGYVAMCEDNEDGDERLASADSTTPELGDEPMYGDEEASVEGFRSLVMTCPNSIVKS